MACKNMAFDPWTIIMVYRMAGRDVIYTSIAGDLGAFTGYVGIVVIFIFPVITFSGRN